MEWTEKRLDLPGLEVAAKVWGRDGGRPVVALHGWLDNAASFDALVPQLGDGLQVAALDLPGHGRSQHRGPAEAYHFIDWVAVVMQAVDALGWESFSLLGHSMGAAIASLVGAVACEQVERMVFLDGLGPWTTPADETVEQVRKALGEEKLHRGQRWRCYDTVEDMLSALAKSRDDVSKERLRLLIKRGTRRSEDGRWTFSYDRKLRTASRMRLTEGQVISFLEALACPVLLVRPRWGWPVEEAVMERRMEAVEGLEVMEVEGGHHVHLEAPERMSTAVGEFLRP